MELVFSLKRTQLPGGKLAMTFDPNNELNETGVPVEDVDEDEKEGDEHGHAAGHHLRRDEERGPGRDHKQT